MAPRWNIFALLTALALFGCAGTKQEAKTVETNPWEDFKGTYAPGAPATIETKPTAKAATKPASESSTSESKSAVTESKPEKPAKGGKPSRAALVAESKPVKPTTSAAESKPATAEPKPIAETKTSAEVKPVLAASDPRSMYGVEPTAGAATKPAAAGADDDDSELVPTAKPKKRGAARKAGVKKAPGARPKKK